MSDTAKASRVRISIWFDRVLHVAIAASFLAPFACITAAAIHGGEADSPFVDAMMLAVIWSFVTSTVLLWVGIPIAEEVEEWSTR